MQATIQYINKELAGLYPESEVKGFERLLFQAICGWNYTQQILNKNEKIGESQFRRFREVVSRLKNFEPIQYILGETEFMGLTLSVNPAVLIPRPETEELVQWILDSNTLGSPRMLDVGTGSGCIPIALKNKISGALISAVDISKEALEVAKLNTSQNNLEIEFLERDILNWEDYDWNTYNVIVSNPPYVRDLEKDKMNKNVLIYEPGNALFVTDNDPLVFYSRIAEFAKKYLVEDGKLFFEINEFFGDEMYNLLLSNNFENIKLRKDINGKNRMIYCQKNSY